MVDAEDIKYFKQRALAERQLCDEAEDESVALIHENLAKRYERLAAGYDVDRPTLRIVTGNNQSTTVSANGQGRPERIGDGRDDAFGTTAR